MSEVGTQLDQMVCALPLTGSKCQQLPCSNPYADETCSRLVVYDKQCLWQTTLLHCATSILTHAVCDVWCSMCWVMYNHLQGATLFEKYSWSALKAMSEMVTAGEQCGMS